MPLRGWTRTRFPRLPWLPLSLGRFGVRHAAAFPCLKSWGSCCCLPRERTQLTSGPAQNHPQLLACFFSRRIKKALSAEGNLEEKVSFSWFPVLLDVMCDLLARQPGRSLAPRDLGGGGLLQIIPTIMTFLPQWTVPACWTPSEDVTYRVSFGSAILQRPYAIPFSNKDTEAQRDPVACPIASR